MHAYASITSYVPFKRALGINERPLD